jgi:hypothetical protein
MNDAIMQETNEARNVHTSHYRNDEHFQYMSEVKGLTVELDPKELKISSQFERLTELFEQEDAALKKINKSVLTKEIQDADKQRDMIFRGIVLSNEAAILKSFRPEVAKAAKNLKILLDTYGNVAQKPLNEETSAIYNLLQELNGKYAPDVATVNIADWVTELAAENAEFEKLVKDRYDETALKTDLVLKDVRLKVDEAYREMVKRVEALLFVEDDKTQKEKYSTFLKKLNVITGKYNNTLAQRQGRSKISNANLKSKKDENED